MAKKLSARFLAGSYAVPDCGVREFVRIFGGEAEVTVANVRKFYYNESTWNRWGEMLDFLRAEFLEDDFTLVCELAEYLELEDDCHAGQVDAIINELDGGSDRKLHAFAQIINRSDVTTEE